MLIPISEMTTLKSAGELKKIADTSYIDGQLLRITRSLNEAANTHSYSITWFEELYPEVRSQLESNQYTIHDVSEYPGEYRYIISFDVDA